MISSSISLRVTVGHKQELSLAWISSRSLVVTGLSFHASSVITIGIRAGLHSPVNSLQERKLMQEMVKENRKILDEKQIPRRSF